MQYALLSHLMGMMATSAAIAGATPPYAIIDVGDLGRPDYTTIRGINNAGVCVGASRYVSGQGNSSTHLYLWQNGVMTDWSNGTGCCSFGHSINALGQAVGRANWDDVGNIATFWDADGTPLPVEVPDSYISTAYGMNDIGDICGEMQFDGPTSYVQPFAWVDGVICRINIFGGRIGKAFSMNSGRVVVGIAERADLSDAAFRWENGVTTELPGLRVSGNDAAADINESGQITGSVEYQYGDFKTVIWEPDGRLRVLQQNPQATDSNGIAIDEFGNVAGNIKIDDTWDGCLWTANGEEIRFQDVLPPKNKWSIRYVWDMNDLGMIVGEGNYPPFTGFGKSRGFVLVPVTPAFSLAQPIPGLAGRRNTLTASGVTPGKKVYFVYGLQGGGSVIPGCDLAETLAAIQIENSKIIGSATANAQGVASLDVNVPGAARNAGEVLIQAVVPTDCVISNLVVEVFE